MICNIKAGFYYFIILLFSIALLLLPAQASARNYNFIIEKGDTLTKYFNELELSPILLANMLAANKKNHMLNRLKLGNKLTIKLYNKDFKSLVYDINNKEMIVISLKSDIFTTSVKSSVYKNSSSLTKQSFIISKNIFYDGRKANISFADLNTISHVLFWKIDFYKDIRQGDEFIIIKNKAGDYSAIIYLGKIQNLAVFSYVDKNNDLDYYDKQGKSLQPSFFKAPLKYSRISSKFQEKRFHPILKVWKSHRAVDFVADVDTPVVSVADGEVSYNSYDKVKSPLGNVVFIEHAGNYRTLYAHLSRLDSSIKKSKLVKQGQIIGYVGSTGRSTGPHLHYELLHNNTHKDPLTHKFPVQKMVSKQDLPSFKDRAYIILRHFNIDHELFDD